MPFNLENEWKPNKKQARFLSIPFSIREALYGGGAGSGKSELLLMFPIVHGFHENSRYKQVLLRRTHKQLKKEILPRSQEFYPKFGATFNESDMLWTFPRLYPDGTRESSNKTTGAKVFLGHCENENDVHIYDSMEINIFTPDEITSLTEYIYVYIGFTRVRSSDPTLPACIRAAGMPGDVGHSFVKKRFVDLAPQGNKIIVGKGGNKRMYIHATLADNDNIDPNYRQSLEALPEAEKQAKLYGSWDAYLGQVFEEFRDKKYPDEPENAIHIVEPFDIPSWWPRIVAIDWGFNAMCSIGWAAISPKKRIYVYRHQYFYGKKISEWAPEVRFFVGKDKPADIIICHSASQHRGDPHSILEQVTEELGQSVRLGEKNRLAGKTLLHEYFRWQPKPVPVGEELKFDNKAAEWILRNKSKDDYQTYLDAFKPTEPESNIPRMLFFDPSVSEYAGIKLIIDSIKACVYVKEAKDGKKQEDVAEFNGDDPYDMLRLLAHSADSFFNMATSEAEKLDKRSEIIRMLEESGNQTAFYMNMRKFDSEEFGSDKPIRFFHKGRRH